MHLQWIKNGTSIEQIHKNPIDSLFFQFNRTMFDSLLEKIFHNRIEPLISDQSAVFNQRHADEYNWDVDYSSVVFRGDEKSLWCCSGKKSEKKIDFWRKHHARVEHWISLFIAEIQWDWPLSNAKTKMLLFRHSIQILNYFYHQQQFSKSHYILEINDD